MDTELDPRIQIELENLNSATDEINKLEIELEEANSTFRILLNESTRRLKLSSKKLGNCIEKARPYYDALEKSREAQIECQKAAVKFQRANEIHAAAKETVALAEQRFMSNSHEWQFDNAWQEMLNHATQKVMDAEKQKAECHTEHQRRTKIFHAAEQKVAQLEDRFRRSILKSRPYFEEKQICQDQLQTQKNRIQELQVQVQTAKSTYATALRNLERISDDIHRQRGDYPQLNNVPPPGPREPGVGAELNSPVTTMLPPLPDFEFELEKCDYPSIAGSQMSLGGSSQRSSDLLSNAPASLATMEDSELEECDEDYAENGDLDGAVDEKDLEELRQKVKILAVRPIEGGDGRQGRNDTWESELNATVNKLDQLMLRKECAKKQQQQQQQQQQKVKQQQPQPQQTKLHQQREEEDDEKQLENKRPDLVGAEAVITTNCGSASNTKIIIENHHHHNYNNNKNTNNDDNNDDDDVIIVKAAAAAAAARAMQATNHKGGAFKKLLGAVTNNNHLTSAADISSSMPATPEHNTQPIKKLQKLEPLPSVNVSMRELPLLARLTNEINERVSKYSNKQRRRSLD